jgi:hypothetical protein
MNLDVTMAEIVTGLFIVTLFEGGLLCLEE